MTEIKLIDNQRDLQQVFRLRYAVYVEELGARMEHADHERKEVREPWDETGDNLGAWINGELVGGVRINYGGASDLSEYRDFFYAVIADQYADCPLERVSVSSKLVVHRRHRGAGLSVRLLQALYTQLQEKKSRLNYMTCRLNLMELYRKFGWQACAPAFHHQEAGWVMPNVLVVEDYDYLRQTNSPFTEVYARYPFRQARARELRKHLAAQRSQAMEAMCNAAA